MEFSVIFTYHTIFLFFPLAIETRTIRAVLGLWALEKRAGGGSWLAALVSLCWPWRRECGRGKGAPGPRPQRSSLGFARIALARIGQVVTQTVRRAGGWKMRRSPARSGSGSGWTQEGLCTHLQTHTQKCVHFQPWTRTQDFPLSLLRMKLEGCPCRRFSQGLQVGWPFPSQALGLPPASASGTCAFFDLSPSTSLPLWKLLQVSK